MNLTERYIFAVTKRIPHSQRADIEKELKSLIEDMIDERGGYSQKIEEEVLTELGNPKKLANNYLGNGNYLIGPEIYDIYLTVLKIAVPVLMALTVFGISVDAVSSGQITFLTILEILGGAFSALLSVFGTVTLVFAILEKQAKAEILEEIKNEKSIKKEWSLEDLPAVENKAKPLSRAGTIAGIVCTLILMFFLNTDYGFIPFFYYQGENITIYQMLNKEVFSSYLLYINLVLVLQLVLQTSKLILGKWTFSISAFNTLLNIGGLIIFFALMNDARLLNVEIFENLSRVEAELAVDISKILSTLKKVFMVLLPLIVLYDSGEGFYYAYKNRNS